MTERRGTTMAALRIIALLTMIGSCTCSPPNCSYWKLWNYLKLTTSNTFVASVRPVKSWETVTDVSIDLILYGILKVDEKSQTVTGATWTTVSWMNEFLVWEPDNFCGLDVITVPTSMVWLPDLGIEEDVSDTSTTKSGPYVKLYSDGLAVSTIRQLLTFTCQLDINLFPFDKQNCTITFESMSSDADVIELTTMSNGTQLSNKSKEVLLTQGEWELMDITITEKTSKNSANETISQLRYNVLVSRRPMLYVINFIVPLLYFLILDLGSFFINEAGGEKLSFKVTILLSISVLLLILNDMLPSTEKTMPWIANYSVAIFALVGISVLEAMTVSYLLSFEEKEKRTPQTCEDDIQLDRAGSKDPLVLMTVSGELTKDDSAPESASVEVQILQQILSEIRKSREEIGRSKYPKNRPRFRKLGMIIDGVFFVLYFLTVVVFLSFVYDQWAKHYFS